MRGMPEDGVRVMVQVLMAVVVAGTFGIGANNAYVPVVADGVALSLVVRNSCCW